MGSGEALLYKMKANCMIWRVCKHILPVGQKTAAVGTMIPVEQSGRGQEVQALAFSCVLPFGVDPAPPPRSEHISSGFQTLSAIRMHGEAGVCIPLRISWVVCPGATPVTALCT